MLEHIEEDDLVLNLIHRALLPNGLVLITVPQHPWLWSSVDEYACHVRRYISSELNEKLVSNGFEILFSTSFVSFLFPAMWLSRIFKKKSLDTHMSAIDGLNLHPVLNRILEVIMGLELAIIRCGCSFPIGGSRLVVARKR